MRAIVNQTPSSLENLEQQGLSKGWKCRYLWHWGSSVPLMKGPSSLEPHLPVPIPQTNSPFSVPPADIYKLSLSLEPKLQT